MRKYYGYYPGVPLRFREPFFSALVLAFLIAITAVFAETAYYFFIQKSTPDITIMVSKGIITLFFGFIFIRYLGKGFLAAFMTSIISPLAFWFYFGIRNQLLTGSFLSAAPEVGQNALLIQGVITLVVFLLYLVLTRRRFFMPPYYR